MGKKKTSAAQAEDSSNVSASSTTTFDPALTALFASSSGPVKAPEKRTASVLVPSTKPRTSSRRHSNSEASESEEPGSASDTADVADAPEDRPRKRRRVADDDLETTYLNRLVVEEEREQRQKQKERSNNTATSQPAESTINEEEDDEDVASSSGSSDGEDASPILHESITQPTGEADKLNRTVFLSNVSTLAITSKSSQKTLLNHLKTALDTKSSEKIESIRFRSTAFAQDAGPKKAAFAKKELMEQTARNTNAYVVLSSEAAARRIAKSLNGTVVLDRHMHIDAFAAPTKTDHRRCVFVGNLPFVDEEVNEQQEADEAGQQRRSKGKEPADAEEGLWRTFGKCGKVESVRVVRDKATRVGKGFAYVQFEDGNGVEKAILLDGKKFPPQLPRLLRVSRAKRMEKKELRKKNQERDNKGRSKGKGANSLALGERKAKLGGVVFEGYRASSSKNKMNLKTKSRGKTGTKPAGRSSRRGAAFRASGGKKKRDA